MNKLVKFLVCLLVIILFSCSSEDSNNTLVTFLELNDGTVWYNGDTADPEYQRIVNNTNVIVEFWDYGDFCSDYGNYSDGVNVNILENIEEKLVVQYSLDGETDTDTYTISNGNLNLVQISTTTNNAIEEVRILSPSNADVDSWDICN